jgi:hypothetical protein
MSDKGSKKNNRYYAGLGMIFGSGIGLVFGSIVGQAKSKNDGN